MSGFTLLAVNSGSSSIKASLFLADGGRRKFQRDHSSAGSEGPATSFRQLLAEMGGIPVSAVCHRIVHGGNAEEPARVIDDRERARLQSLIHLAPLHMPDNLAGVDFFSAHLSVPQIACYDTSFHRSMPEQSRRFALPASSGVERYGFHGINFGHIAATLPARLTDAQDKRIVVAHLGSGVSLCLLENLRSSFTTMGMTPLGGTVMATRCGDLDPGIVLALSEQMPMEQLTGMLYRQSGLLALSEGISGDMKTLIESADPRAKFAVDYFCASIRSSIGALAARAGGIDALVFTGGIGENSPEIRGEICARLEFLGISLDATANRSNRDSLHQAGSIPILRITADEEAAMVSLARGILEAR